MDELNAQNQPPVSLVPEQVANDVAWPIKKKSNKRAWKVVGGIMALLLVVGVALGSFYFTRNLNQAVVPTAPVVNPFASEKCPWSAPIDISTLPGSGAIQAQAEVIFPNNTQLLQSIYRGDKGYWRIVPVESGNPVWASAGAWSAPIDSSTLPGSGTVQTRSDFIIGNGANLVQALWRGGQGFTRTVPIVNGGPDWNNAGAWSAPIDVSTLPGSGAPGLEAIQAQAEVIFPNNTQLLQSIYRGGFGYWRIVPVVSGNPVWASAGAWSAPLDGSTLPGSGTVQTRSDFIIGNGSYLMQAVWRGDQGFWRMVPIANSTPQWTCADVTVTPPTTRENYCVSTSSNKDRVQTGETLTLSSVSNTSVNGFYWAAYNSDNNPAGNDPKGICTGTEAASTNCPNGGKHLIFSDPNNKNDGTGLRTTGSIQIPYANLSVLDKTTGQQVRNIQFNGYFNLNGGPFSLPIPACVAYTSVEACVDTIWTPATNTVCTGTNLTQTGNCGNTRVVEGTKADATWTPATNTVCTGTNLTQTGDCGNTRVVAGTKADTTWTPATNTVCTGTNLTQTGNCGATRSVAGTKADTTWTPAVASVCSEKKVTQTGNCGGEREVDGTKACSSDLSMVKKAYRDESSNTAGTYRLVGEIDNVSKDQVFVYIFEIENTGEAKAENITVVDTLKGDNQEELTFVDSDSRCSYASSTRKITCAGMSLEADKVDAYKFRVKVSSGAVNGETIRNVGTLTYKDMVGDGADATLELAISTVVGCNNTCTSDDECVSGLSCDPSTNKCRKPTCSEASSCNCPVENVASGGSQTGGTQTGGTTAVRTQPTVLPETGILDFPGIAAFGGGLLLAIVGILLAL